MRKKKTRNGEKAGEKKNKTKRHKIPIFTQQHTTILKTPPTIRDRTEKKKETHPQKLIQHKYTKQMYADR